MSRHSKWLLSQSPRSPSANGSISRVTPRSSLARTLYALRIPSLTSAPPGSVTPPYQVTWITCLEPNGQLLPPPQGSLVAARPRSHWTTGTSSAKTKDAPSLSGTTPASVSTKLTEWSSERRFPTTRTVLGLFFSPPSSPTIRTVRQSPRSSAGARVAHLTELDCLFSEWTSKIACLETF